MWFIWNSVALLLDGKRKPLDWLRFTSVAGGFFITVILLVRYYSWSIHKGCQVDFSLHWYYLFQDSIWSGLVICIKCFYKKIVSEAFIQVPFTKCYLLCYLLSIFVHVVRWYDNGYWRAVHHIGLYYWIWVTRKFCSLFLGWSTEVFWLTHVARWVFVYGSVTCFRTSQDDCE